MGVLMGASRDPEVNGCPPSLRSISRNIPVPGSNNTKLSIEFDDFPAFLMPVSDEGKYWILALETDKLLQY